MITNLPDGLLLPNRILRFYQNIFVGKSGCQAWLPIFGTGEDPSVLCRLWRNKYNMTWTVLTGQAHWTERDLGKV